MLNIHFEQCVILCHVLMLLGFPLNCAEIAARCLSLLFLIESLEATVGEDGDEEKVGVRDSPSEGPVTGGIHIHNDRTDPVQTKSVEYQLHGSCALNLWQCLARGSAAAGLFEEAAHAYDSVLKLATKVEERVEAESGLARCRSIIDALQDDALVTGTGALQDDALVTGTGALQDDAPANGSDVMPGTLAPARTPAKKPRGDSADPSSITSESTGHSLSSSSTSENCFGNSQNRDKEVMPGAINYEKHPPLPSVTMGCRISDNKEAPCAEIVHPSVILDDKARLSKSFIWTLQVRS